MPLLLLVWVQLQWGSRDGAKGEQGTLWGQRTGGTRTPSAAKHKTRMGAGTPRAHAAPSPRRPSVRVCWGTRLYVPPMDASSGLLDARGQCSQTTPDQDASDQKGKKNPGASAGGHMR